MKIDCLVLGAYETNCYVLRHSDASKDCLVIDPGLRAEELVAFLREHRLNATAVVLTHGHADHIAGVTLLRETFLRAKVYIHRLDAHMLTEPESNLSVLAGERIRSDPADILVEEQSVIEEADVQLRVLHTPGHTPGGICLYAEQDGFIFTDDTLFAESVGRADFPGGNMPELLQSIKQKLLALPDHTTVYPGHGPATTIADEKAHNPFLK